MHVLELSSWSPKEGLTVIGLNAIDLENTVKSMEETFPGFHEQEHHDRMNLISRFRQGRMSYEPPEKNTKKCRLELAQD